MPVLLIDVLKHYVSLDSPEHFKKSIFMILSNSAAEEITQKSLKLESPSNNKRENFELESPSNNKRENFEFESTSNIKRENFEPIMFHKIIENKIYNEKIKIDGEEKGFWKLDLIKSQSIDYYIPFLPLKREHVKLCIIAEIKKYNVRRSDNYVDAIAEEIFTESDFYSKTGCKRIPQLIRTRIFRSQKAEL